MVRHGGSSAGSYLADPTSPIPAHCASIAVTGTVRVKVQTLASDVQDTSVIHFLKANQLCCGRPDDRLACMDFLTHVDQSCTITY